MPAATGEDTESVLSACAFAAHTLVPAVQVKFPTDMVRQVLALRQGDHSGQIRFGQTIKLPLQTGASFLTEMVPAVSGELTHLNLEI